MLVNKSDAQLPVFILHLDQRRLNIVAALGTKQLHSSIDLLRVSHCAIRPVPLLGYLGYFSTLSPTLRNKANQPRQPIPSFLNRRAVSEFDPIADRRKCNPCAERNLSEPFPFCDVV